MLTARTPALLCSLLSLTTPQATLIFLSVCHRLCTAQPAGTAGRLGSCEGWPRGEEGRARKASHWGHLLSPLPSHQHLAGTLTSQPHSRSWSTMALHKQVPAAFHIFSYSCPGALAEMECILLWWCFVLFRNNSSWYHVVLSCRAFIWCHSQRGSSWHLLPFVIFIYFHFRISICSTTLALLAVCFQSIPGRPADRGMRNQQPTYLCFGGWKGLLWSSFTWSHESNTFRKAAGSRRTFHIAMLKTWTTSSTE